MTVAAIAIGASVAVAAAGSAYAASQSAEGASDAQATLQGGINRMEAFRSQIRQDSQVYRQWKEDVTGKLVEDVLRAPTDSQAYRDNLRRFESSNAAAGISPRGGAAFTGRRELAQAETDRHFVRRAAVGQLLGTETARSDRLSASVLSSENQLLGGKSDAQIQEANAKAAGTEAVAGGISGALSAGAGAYGAYRQGQGGPSPLLGGLPDDYASIDTGGSALLGGGYTDALDRYHLEF